MDTTTIAVPHPDTIRNRMATLRKEQIALRKLLRLAKAAEEAEQARQERENQQQEEAHASSR
jgi:hypothetical protein